MTNSTCCNCDACYADLTDDAVDGYCRFCDEHCFPVVRMDGGTTRARLTAQSRVILHAARTESSEELRRKLARENAKAIMQAVRPIVEPQARKVIARAQEMIRPLLTAKKKQS